MQSNQKAWQDAQTDAALTAGEELSHQLTDSVHPGGGERALLWVGDFADGLCAGIGIAAGFPRTRS